MQNMLALNQAFPKLNANETYKMLMLQLEELQQTIRNSYRNAFPQILVASKLSFEIVSYFELDNAEFEQKIQSFQKYDDVILQELLNSNGNAMGDFKNFAIASVKKGIDLT